MHGVMHVSIRVSDPGASARMFAELMGGEIRPTPMNKWGVVCLYTSDAHDSWLMNMLEFWPAHKHWHAGRLMDVDPEAQRSYSHLAILTDKSNAEIAAIAKRFGATVSEEDRGMPAPVPVLYDELGNYFEFFPARSF